MMAAWGAACAAARGSQTDVSNERAVRVEVRRYAGSGLGIDTERDPRCQRVRNRQGGGQRGVR